MTSGHFIFIPAVLCVGMFIGFLLGTRAAQDRVNLELKRQAEREAARKARAERKAARAPGEAGGSGAGTAAEADSVEPRD
jgi:hypothetical protein